MNRFDQSIRADIRSAQTRILPLTALLRFYRTSSTVVALLLLYEVDEEHSLLLEIIFNQFRYA